MSDTSTDRVIRFTGIAFVVLFVAIIVVSPDVGNPGDSAQRLTALLQAHTVASQVFLWIEGLQAVLLLVFIAGVTRRLRLAGEGTLAAVAFGGAVFVAALVTVQHACVAALEYLVQAGHPDAAALTTLNPLSYGVETVSRFGMAVMVGAVATAVLRSHVAASWIGWLGLAQATLSLVAAGSTSTTGPMAVNGPVAVPSLLFLLVWVLATSISSRPAQVSRRTGLVPATGSP